MSDAILSIKFAGPLVTYQDIGRFGQMRFGVANSGPMDRVAFAAAHAALGNTNAGTAIEISLGGLELTCKSGAITLAVAGGDFIVEHNRSRFAGWRVLTLGQGDRLAIRAGESGSWAYLAFAGIPKAANWLGSTSTHSTSGFGGGQLASGDEIQISDAEVRGKREGDVKLPDFYSGDNAFRVVMGPQEKHFLPQTKDVFLNSQFTLTDNYDRMGLRLKGQPLLIGDALAIPSEPIVRGSIQVSGDGVPTILLADHQTTGGYPKIATMISTETDRLVQRRSKQSISFKAVSPMEAIEITREFHACLEHYLSQISKPRGSLQQRLMCENLVSGVVFAKHALAG